MISKLATKGRTFLKVNEILVFILLFPIVVFAQDTISQPKLSVISLDNVKVVYRGVDNPISIAVQNAKSFTISGSGIILNKDGKYTIKPGSGIETKVYVKIVLLDNSIVTEEHVFQIKGLPSPTGTLNNQFSTQGYLEFSLEELKDAKLGIILIDFIFKLNLEVTEYTLKVPRHKALIIKGNIITEEALNLIKKARRKDFIIISNMKGNYMGTNQNPKPISSIIFHIMK